MTKIITQKHSMGCGVACVASLLNLSYDDALLLFKNPSHAWTRGFMCKELIDAIAKIYPNFKYSKIKNTNDPILKMLGTIVFTESSKAYPLGHYLLKTKNGWMNPWINYPIIAPAKGGIVRELPGQASYVIFSKNNSAN